MGATLPVLELRGVSKQFLGVRALTNVGLRLFPGEVHALMGQNGAGKSTLIKVLTGVYAADAGTLSLGGEAIQPASPAATPARARAAAGASTGRA